MKKILVLIFGFVIVVGLISYCYFVNNKNIPTSPNGEQINIQGITPYDLDHGPVPKLGVNFSEQPQIQIQK